LPVWGQSSVPARTVLVSWWKQKIQSQTHHCFFKSYPIASLLNAARDICGTDKRTDGEMKIRLLQSSIFPQNQEERHKLYNYSFQYGKETEGDTSTTGEREVCNKISQKQTLLRKLVMEISHPSEPIDQFSAQISLSKR